MIPISIQEIQALIERARSERAPSAMELLWIDALEERLARALQQQRQQQTEDTDDG